MAEDDVPDEVPSPADYTINVPAGSELERGVLDRFKAVFRSGKLTQEQVDHLLAWHERLQWEADDYRAAAALEQSQAAERAQRARAGDAQQRQVRERLEQGWEEARLKDRQKALLTKQHTALGLTAQESEELRQSFVRRVELQRKSQDTSQA